MLFNRRRRTFYRRHPFYRSLPSPESQPFQPQPNGPHHKWNQPHLNWKIHSQGRYDKKISRSLRTTVTAAQSKALQAILHAYIFRNTDTQAAILHKFFHQVDTSKSRASRSTQRSPFQQYLRAIAAARLEAIHANQDSLYTQLDTAITEIEDNALSKLDRALTKIEQSAAKHKHRTRRANSPGQRPRRKQLPSGSYETWRVHHSQSKQSTHWEKRSTSSQEQLRESNKLRNTKTFTEGNLSSKRRSENKIKPHDQQEGLNSKSESKNKNYYQHRTQNLGSEGKTTREVTKEDVFTQIKAKVTKKVNEVKATESMLTQLNQRIGQESKSTLPSRFKAMFNASICIYILIIFICKNFSSNSQFNRIRSVNHLKYLQLESSAVARRFCLSQLTASTQAETSMKTPANTDSRQLSKVLETRPNLRYQELDRNLFVPSHLYSGLIRNSGNHLYHDSFIFNYLDSSR